MNYCVWNPDREQQGFYRCTRCAQKEVWLHESQRGRVLRQCRATGPGTFLHRLLSTLNIATGVSCKPCETMAAKMNKWGSDGCLEHFEEIIDHLRTKAKERSILFWEPAARFLVNRAIKLARRDLARQQKLLTKKQQTLIESKQRS